MIGYEGRLFSDGKFREARSSRRYDVINPADESVVGRAADAAAEDVSDAVSAARRAADETSWSTDHEFRRGWGISGDGVEHGVAGFREYLRIKSIASPAKV